MDDDELQQLEQTAHNMIKSLVLMRALSLPHAIINEAQLIDNYISLYAVRQAMWNAVQQGMYRENPDESEGGWLFNEDWQANESQ